MKTLAMFLLIWTTNALADQWFCTDEASQRTGDVIKVCGIGEDKEEGPARIKAFKNARSEFYQLCNTSSDCVDHFYFSAPMRTDCTKDEDGYKCHRMIQFTIGALIQRK